MNKYFVDTERGFANEYTLAVAPDSEIASSLEEAGYKQITRKDWIERLRMRHNYAGYIGLDGVDPTGMSDLIATSADATRLYLKDCEDYRVSIRRLR